MRKKRKEKAKLCKQKKQIKRKESDAATKNNQTHELGHMKKNASGRFQVKRMPQNIKEIGHKRSNKSDTRNRTHEKHF